MQLLQDTGVSTHINHVKTTEVFDNDIEMSDLSMSCCNMETNAPETEEEKRNRKNREKSARYREKKSLIGYSDKELDDIREKVRLRVAKHRKNVAKRKAQEQIQAAATSKIGHNNSGGGDGVIKNGQLDVDTNIDVDEDTG